MIDFSTKSYTEVICAVLGIFSISLASYSANVSDCDEFERQRKKLLSGDVDFDGIAKILVPYARHEMDMGFKDHA